MSTSKATFDWSNLIFKIDGLFCLSLEFLFYFPFDQFASAHCTIGQCPDCLALCSYPIRPTTVTVLICWSSSCYWMYLIILSVLFPMWPSWKTIFGCCLAERQQRSTGADNLHWYPWHMDIQTFHTPCDFAVWVTRSGCKYLNKDHH